jgi:hypothetical protein
MPSSDRTFLDSPPAPPRGRSRGGGIPARASTFAVMMRSFVLLYGLSALLACAGARGEAAPPETRPEPPVVAAPGSGPAPVVADAPAPADASARLLAEVRAMQPADRWAWALAAMPALAEHREIGTSDLPFVQFRAAQRERTTLWVRPRGERCFAVRGEWDEYGFAGRGRETTTIRGNHKTVRFESITIGEHGISVSGPHGDEYTRDARGRWQPDGAFGVGRGAAIAEGTVGSVERGAADYDGYERCADGSTRRCSRCTELTALRQAPNRWSGAGGMAGVVGPGEPVDCSQPCPPNDLGDRVAALGLAVEGRRFLGTEDPVAAVYADASTCRGDRRMRAAPAE